jgi:hypothetical protein
MLGFLLFTWTPQHFLAFVCAASSLEIHPLFPLLRTISMGSASLNSTNCGLKIFRKKFQKIPTKRSLNLQLNTCFSE